MRKFIKYASVFVLIVIITGLVAWGVLRITRGADSYVGLTETEAIERAQNRGLMHRIIERNGKALPFTDDQRTDRINFEIEDGKVTEAVFY